MRTHRSPETKQAHKVCHVLYSPVTFDYNQEIIMRVESLGKALLTSDFLYFFSTYSEVLDNIFICAELLISTSFAMRRGQLRLWLKIRPVTALVDLRRYLCRIVLTPLIMIFI